jgi:pre-peptidase
LLLEATASISDDKGIKDAPLFYYAMTQPATPPDLSHMTQLTMRSTAGDRTSGTYAVTVPNPVAQMPAGTKQTVYYVFVASDNDDTTGTCNHTTTSQVYAIAVTSTGTANLPICSACTSDAQCGSGDECVRMGASGDSFCLQACGAGCPSGYTCSTMPVTSVDGASAPQCVPNSGSCEMTTTTCSDDSWEVNDTQSDASHNPALAPGHHDLVSCPSTTNATRANDDWFKIVVPSDQRVDLQLAGGTASDLDLHLYHSNGTVITASTGLDASEDISECLPAATYYVKVNGFGSARNAYALSYASHAESCTVACTDDSHEPDDTAATARATTYPAFSSSGNQICTDDDDWYKVPLFTGELMSVDLTFTQSNASQDLDIHLYRNGTDLTPCDVGDPLSCSIDNGQGAVSNEHTDFIAPAGCDDGCDYYVIVRGYNHSTNSYSIAIAIQ